MNHGLRSSGARTGGLAAAATGNRAQRAADSAEEDIGNLHPFAPFVVLPPPQRLPAFAEIGEICG